ncbi:MAG: SpoIID/LytB domain-containing protein [FCB group bacterium]|nr:SpoIID/LytB domain-containing protein [FCB group bacterium]
MKKLQNIKTNLARLSILVFLIVILWGCGRVPHLTDVAPPSSRLPFVKVLLDEVSRKHTIGGSDGGEMAINCFKNGKRISYYSRKPVIVQAENQKLGLYTHSGQNLDYKIDRMVIASRTKNHGLTYDKKAYHGLLEFVSSSGQIRLVNIVYVEDYLKGVVPLEIGPTPEEQVEAVKAQSVAARTYAMAHLGQYGDESGYDLKADISDQVYGGIKIENQLVNEAVEATRGMVAVYNDQMISAYYHSTCGGTTDDIEDVWDKEAAPYLVSGHDDEACKISKYYTWRERFTADQIILRVEQYLAQERGREVNAGRLTDIRINGRTPGGRVASITFETTNGRFTFNKEKVRWVIKRSDNPKAILRSANFDLDIERHGNGEVREVVFRGRGYGHGIGMCQMGARGLAAKGIKFDSILATYYKNTDLKKLY